LKRMMDLNYFVHRAVKKKRTEKKYI